MGATALSRYKVIAISGIYQEFAVAKMVHSGACAFVAKDALPCEFKRTIDAVHQHGFYLGGEQGALVRQLLQSSSYNWPVNRTSLSEMEIRLLQFCGTARTYKQIAHELKLSVKQVEHLRDKLCEQLGVQTRSQLAVFAVYNGFDSSHYVIGL